MSPFQSLSPTIWPTERNNSMLFLAPNNIGEYRTRLAADVVTGKLDVRPSASKLPELTPEPTATSEPDVADESETEGVQA